MTGEAHRATAEKPIAVVCLSQLRWGAAPWIKDTQPRNGVVEPAQMGVFHERYRKMNGYMGDFYYKVDDWGYPHLWKPPNVSVFFFGKAFCVVKRNGGG